MRNTLIAETAEAPSGRRRTAARAPFVADALSMAALLLVTVIAAWPFLTAADVNTGAGDWPAHRFRVEEVLERGIAPWSPAWSGGMPLWEGYQVVPHLITAAVVWVTGLGTARIMALLTGLLLLLLRLNVYVACRGFGVPPLAALIGSLLTAALDSVRQPLANYSELWGLALAPLALAAGYRWAGRPGGFLVAALFGLAVEIHPLLTVTGGVALAAGWAGGRCGRSLSLCLGQGAVLLVGAAVFWLPVLLSSAPRAGEPYYASLDFSRLLFTLASAGFLPGWPAWMLAVAGALALVHGRSRPAAQFLLVAGLLVAGTVGVSLTPWCPEPIRSAQLVRLVSLLPLLAGVAGALLLARLFSFGPRIAPLTALVILGALALARGREAPVLILTESALPDPLTQAWMAGVIPAGSGRVWADPVITAQASAATRGAIPMGGNYAARDRSLLYSPLQLYLSGWGTAVDRTAYLVAHQIAFLLVPDGVRPEIVALSGEDGEATWRPVWSGDGYELLRAPWPTPGVWTFAGARRTDLTPPDAAFRDVESAYLRDRAVEAYARAALAGTPAAVRFDQRGTTMEIALTSESGGQYLAVNQNWDRGWRASLNGRRLAVERFGPHMIGIDLSGTAGDRTIRLERVWPFVDRAALLMSALAVPVASLLAWWWGRHAAVGESATASISDEAGAA